VILLIRRTSFWKSIVRKDTVFVSSIKSDVNPYQFKFCKHALHVMQKTIRNVDEKLFEQLKKAARTKEMTVGEAVNEAVLQWLNSQEEPELSIMEFEPISLSEEGEVLSESYEEELYG